MALLELLSLSTALFIFFTLFLIPFGYLLLTVGFPSFPVSLRLMLSFGVSALFYGLLTSSCVLMGLPNQMIGLVLIVVVIVSLWIWLVEGHWRIVLGSEFHVGLAMVYLYYLLCMVASAFPSASISDVGVDKTMQLLGLPVDNLIPYQFSRFLVEGLNVSSLEIVPGWHAAERGPLAGVLNAAVFFIFGLEEQGPWMTTTPILFFVFQALISYLNLLAALAVWYAANLIFGRREAVCALLLLFSTFFFFRNIIFTWPKFFMAYFIISALVVWLANKNTVVIGVFLAGALLAHNSAAFYVVSFIAVMAAGALFSFIRSKAELSKSQRIKPALLFFFSFFLILSPWFIYKKVIQAPPSKLVSMHLFCSEAPGAGFWKGYEAYTSKRTAADILNARVENISFPFSLERLVRLWPRFWNRPLEFLMAMRDSVYQRFIYAIGLPAILLLLYSFYSCTKDFKLRKTLPISAICLGGLVVASLVFGCSPATSNHLWAYPLFAASALLIGRVAATGGIIVGAIFMLLLVGNIVTSVFLFYYVPGTYIQPYIAIASVFSHASTLYTVSLVSLAAVLWLVCFWELAIEAKSRNLVDA